MNERSSRGRSLFPRRLVLLAALPALGLAVPLAALLSAQDEPHASSVVVREPVPEPAPRTDPSTPRLRDLQKIASDPARSVAERTDALGEIARTARDAGALLAILRGLGVDDRHRAAVIAAALPGLARWADDPRVRARLLESLSLETPRSERLLALTTLASVADGEWCRPYVEALTTDPDPQVRERAEAWARGR